MDDYTYTDNYELLFFIDDIKSYYLKWLADYEPAFPLCCFSASEILCSYLQEKFGVGTLVLSKKKKTSRYFNVHAYVKVNDIIVDFTYFQYKMHNFKLKGLKNLGLTEQELSDFCFGLFNGPILSDELVEDFVFRDELANLRFTEEARSAIDFEDYLNLVLQTKDFENYSILALYSEEPYFWRECI